MSSQGQNQETDSSQQPQLGVDAPLSPPIPSPNNGPEKHGLTDEQKTMDQPEESKRIKLDGDDAQPNRHNSEPVSTATDGAVASDTSSSTRQTAPLPVLPLLSETTSVPTPQESEYDGSTANTVASDGTLTNTQQPTISVEPTEVKMEVDDTPVEHESEQTKVEEEISKEDKPAEPQSEEDKSAQTLLEEDKVAETQSEETKPDETQHVQPAVEEADTSITNDTSTLGEGPILPQGQYDPPEGAEKGLAKHQLKYAGSVLRSMKRLKDAAPFLAPVDAVKLNVPTYYEVVKQPMDLGTMEKKLQGGEYESVSLFVADFELIVDNCVMFNGSDAAIATMAKNIRGSFTKHMANMPLYDQPEAPKPPAKRRSFAPVAGTPKSQRAAAQAANAALNGDVDSPSYALQPSGIPTIRRESTVTEGGRPKREIHPPKPRDLPYGDVKPRKKKYAAELKFCGQVLRELMSRKNEGFSYPFLQPVDPVALGCPSYFKVIKQPMDLGTIQEKYNTNQYETADDFAGDVRLMLKNCYKFNPDGSPVNLMGHKLEEVFERKWQERPSQAPSPSANGGRESDFEYSDEEDYEEMGITNPAIKFLEEQIDRMQAELNKLKKEAVKEYREQRRKSGPVRKRKSNANGGSARRDKSEKKRSDKQASMSGLSSGPAHVTYEMKVKLSESIGTLPEKKLRHVVQIIQESMPQLKDTNEDEIELDLEKIEPNTLMKLYNFVVRDNGEKRPSNAGTSAYGTTKRSKSKPLTEDEQSKEIESLQQKLREFDSLQNGGGSNAVSTSMSPHQNTAAVHDSSDDSSDEEEDDSSSSEEE